MKRNLIFKEMTSTNGLIFSVKIYHSFQQLSKTRRIGSHLYCQRIRKIYPSSPFYSAVLQDGTVPFRM